MEVDVLPPHGPLQEEVELFKVGIAGDVDGAPDQGCGAFEFHPDAQADSVF